MLTRLSIKPKVLSGYFLFSSLVLPPVTRFLVFRKRVLAPSRSLLSAYTSSHLPPPPSTFLSTAHAPLAPPNGRRCPANTPSATDNDIVALDIQLPEACALVAVRAWRLDGGVQGGERGGEAVAANPRGRAEATDVEAVRCWPCTATRRAQRCKSCRFNIITLGNSDIGERSSGERPETWVGKELTEAALKHR